MSVIIEVNGLEIKENSLYKIVDKIDNNALDGLKQYGSTKIPQDFMSTSCQCPWDERTEVRDTGFYTQSPCYSGMNEATRSEIVSQLQEKIVEPYEQIYGFGILDNKNESFWANYIIELEEGRIFNTGNIKDLLDLYIAMRGFELTPKDKKGDPKFKESQFMIEDRDVTNKRRNERDKNFMDSMQHFFTLLTTQKHKLISVLKYVRMNGADNMNLDTDNSVINSFFKNWVENDVKNVDNFLRVIDMMKKKQGTEEVTLFSLLLDLSKANKLPKVGEEFTYADVPLGPDLKTAAKNLATKTALKETKQQLLQEETIE